LFVVWLFVSLGESLILILLMQTIKKIDIFAKNGEEPPEWPCGRVFFLEYNPHERI
jgi:hypothetical protein